MSTSIPETSPSSSPHAAFFHDASHAVRFWVRAVGGEFVGASISIATLHFRFQGDVAGTNAVATYETHRVAIDDAVRRRLAKGSLEPVLLRDVDLNLPPR